VHSVNLRRSAGELEKRRRTKYELAPHKKTSLGQIAGERLEI